MIPGGFYLDQPSNWGQPLALQLEVVSCKLLEISHIFMGTSMIEVMFKDNT